MPSRHVELVLAQEHLVRGMRGVRLVLVDERRGLVGVLVDIVGVAQNAIGVRVIGGARQQHEVGRAACHVERIVGRSGI